MTLIRGSASLKKERHTGSRKELKGKSASIEKKGTVHRKEVITLTEPSPSKEERLQRR